MAFPLFPPHLMIGADGNVFGHVPGAPGDTMESIVQQTIDGVEA